MPKGKKCALTHMGAPVCVQACAHTQTHTTRRGGQASLHLYRGEPHTTKAAELVTELRLYHSVAKDINNQY